MQGNSLDYRYLEHWAEILGIEELLVGCTNAGRMFINENLINTYLH